MSSQPIARPPAERTLFVAVALLCAIAAVQIVAAIIALVPRIDYDGIARAMEARRAGQQTVATSAAPSPAAPASSAVAEQVNALLAEAQDFRQKNNARGAVEAYVEADRLDPGKPGILYPLAEAQFVAGQHEESVATLEKLLALPAAADPANAEYVGQAKNALQQLTAPAARETPAPGAAAPATEATKEAAAMRDDVGIPIGSVMGIVKAELVDGEPGHKNLRVSMKGASDTKIDPTKVHATVDFFEQDDQAQVVRNSSPNPSEWLSAPVDWAEAAPEIFQVKYRLPLEDRGDVPPLQYYGYVVAIYYDGELQDQRADPPSLLEEHAPPLQKDAAPAE
jgi:hypothetical protein